MKNRLFRISFDGDRLDWQPGGDEAEALRNFLGYNPTADVHRVRLEWLWGDELLDEMRRHGHVPKEGTVESLHIP